MIISWHLIFYALPKFTTPVAVRDHQSCDTCIQNTESVKPTKYEK